MELDQAAVHQSSVGFTRKYILSATVLALVMVAAVFWGFDHRSNRLIRDQLLHEARAFFQEIVETRHWIIRNRGVYTRRPPAPDKRAIMAAIPGLETEIRAGGTTYYLHNHAIVTNAISALGKRKRLFGIRLLSDRPLNPDNAARDGFEKRALAAFTAGRGEVSRFEQEGGAPVFRYLAPLFVSRDCLGCHGVQGYRVGELRGAIEVIIPAGEIVREMRRNRVYTTAAAAAVLVLLLALAAVISRRYLRDLGASERKLMFLASTDPLTGLLNRREGMGRFQQELVRYQREGRPIGVMIIDIDHFKAINDRHGHAAGDRALKAVADAIMRGVRDYDIVCRYGGEEFLVVMPGNDLAGARDTGERIIAMIRSLRVGAADGPAVTVTASAGVTAVRDGDDMDRLVSRADDAMYRAKAEGRDRVCVAE